MSVHRPLLQWFMEKLSQSLGTDGRPATPEELARRLGVSERWIAHLMAGRPVSRRLTLKMADRGRIPRAFFLKVSGYDPERADWERDKARYGIDGAWSREALSALSERKPLHLMAAPRQKDPPSVALLCLLIIPLLVLGTLLLVIPEYFSP